MTCLMIDSILKILASVGGIYAAFYISKKIAGWLQAWKNRQQKDEATEARIKAQIDNQRANAENDALRDIDGR